MTVAPIPSTQKAVAFTGHTEIGKFTEIIQIPVVNPPPAGKLLVKVRAAALNPTDWKGGVYGRAAKGDTVGSDNAGTVVAVGEGVTGFAVGDTVASFTISTYHAAPLGGALQQYFVADPDQTLKFEKPLVASALTSARKIDSFETAAAVPMGLATVGQSFQYNLKLTLDKEANRGKYILIWGGATATGILAVQVAKKMYGLTVLTTASTKHHKWLKEYGGADYTFDYHDDDVCEQIKAVVGNDLTVALDTVSNTDTYNDSYEVLSSTKASRLDNLLNLGAGELIDGNDKTATLTQTLVYFALGKAFVPKADGTGAIEPKQALVDAHRKQFWPAANKAVNDGTVLCPPLSILPGGFHAVENGLTLLRTDEVSGEKLIVRVSDIVL